MRSDHLSKHIKTHYKSRGQYDSLVEVPMKEESKPYTTNVEIAKVLGTLSDDEEKDVKQETIKNESMISDQQEEDMDMMDEEMDSCGEESVEDEKILHIGELTSEVADHGNQHDDDELFLEQFAYY